MTAQQIAPRAFPRGELKLPEHCNKKIADGAGLSFLLLPRTSKKHLNFQILLDFIGGRQSILFGNISIVIDKKVEDPDDQTMLDAIRDAWRKVCEGNAEEEVEFLYTTIIAATEFDIQPEVTGGIYFHVSIKIPSTGSEYKGRSYKSFENSKGWTTHTE